MLRRSKATSSASEIGRVTSFINSVLKNSDARGVVIGLSGGVDSSVVAALCARALGPRKVLGVYMFEQGANRNSEDYKDAQSVAKLLGLKTVNLPITLVLRAVELTLEKGQQSWSRLTGANMKARIRMTLLYAIANQRNLLVAGTGDRSEILLGYFTKFGDGAADFLPIAHLYKTEVRALAAELRLPLRVIVKPSSPNLWKGQKASDELPTDYDVLDRILKELFEVGADPKKVMKELDVPPNIVVRTMRMHTKSQHKRMMAPALER